MSTTSTRSSSVNTGIIVPKSTSSDFHWEITEFSMACKDVGSFISPEFSIQVEGIAKSSGIAKWRLKLYSDGYRNEEKDDVALFILYSGDDTISAKVILSLLDTECSKVITQKMTVSTINAKSHMWGFKKFSTKQFIMDAKNRVLTNDTFKLQCEISISELLHVWQKNLEIFIFNLKKDKEERSPLIHRLQEFDDYEKLLENGNYSDIAIVVGEEQFLVHKAIITSRSTVFEAMFKHDMKEKEENTIEITDIKSLMKEVLRFMYAGKVSKIEQMTSDLLLAAEKYSITGLKKLCVQTMLENLKIENALEFLKLADMCNAPDLKSRVIEFVASNQKAIAEKPEFGIFKDLHSDLQFELVQAIIAKNSNQ